MNWYYAKEGQPTGPVTESEFNALVQSGAVGPTTLVWREGLPNWVAYQTIAPAAAPVPAENLPPLAAPPVAESPPGQVLCAECRRYFPPEEVIQVADQHVCAACKPLFVQKIQEGVPTTSTRLPFATFWPRFGAFFIDGLIIGVVNMLFIAPLMVFMIGAQRGGQPNIAVTILFQLAITGISIITDALYQTFFVHRYAATPGKMVFRLVVVRADGSRLTLGRCVGRAFGRMLSNIVCYIGYLLALFDEEKRTLHDHLCDTRVVVKNHPFA